MTELNERLARAVGFKPCDCEKGCRLWITPDRVQSIDLPDFPTSMDACNKHIKPKLVDLQSIEFEYGWIEVGKVTCHLHFRNHERFDGYDTTEETAFCLAAIKYFEVSK
jgi:hypothetical protein